MRIPINGADYQNYSDKVNAQKTINWYPEVDPTGKNNLILHPTPGASLIRQPSGASGAVRGMNSFPRSNSTYQEVFALVDDTMYSSPVGADITTAWTSRGSTGESLASAVTDNTTKIVEDGDYIFWTGSYDVFFIRASDTSATVGKLAQYSTGTNTSTSTNKLIDSGATFVTDGTPVGITVYNDTDSTRAVVTSVDSETQLTLSSDIFTGTGKTYTVGDSFVDSSLSISSIEYMDGYFIAGTLAENKVYISTILEPTHWSSLDYQEVGDSGNWIRAIERVGRYLFILGVKEVEVWSNVGNEDFPFERLPNVNLPYALQDFTGASVANFGDFLIFVGQNSAGPGVFMTQGFSVKKISDFPIDRKLLTTTLSGATLIDYLEAFPISWKGHQWYVLNFVSDDETWVYDITTGSWFQWSSGASGARCLARCHFYSHTHQKHLVGHTSDGNIYELSDTTYTDNGTAIVRTRQSPVLNNEHNTLFQKSIELVVDSGASAAGTQELDIKWSKDGGDTFGSTYTIDATEADPTLYITDAGRSFVYHITTNDAYGPTIIDAYANFRLGRSKN